MMQVESTSLRSAQQSKAPFLVHSMGVPLRHKNTKKIYNLGATQICLVLAQLNSVFLGKNL